MYSLVLFRLSAFYIKLLFKCGGLPFFWRIFVLFDSTEMDPNEKKLWSSCSGQRCSALMSWNTRRDVSFLFTTLTKKKKPQDASWRRPLPSVAVHPPSLKGAESKKQRGKVIFFSCLSIFGGFPPLFLFFFGRVLS